MKLHFLGAADTVTGSRHLVEIGGQRLLLDCGLFQGFKTLRERNWAPLPYPPKEIDAVVLSQAHLDHSGYLPVLMKHGFKGPIYCTAATRDLAEVLLLDCAHLQEEDARRANRGGFSGHADANELMDWLRGFEKPPSQTFVVHGVTQVSDTLRLRIADQLGWKVKVPEHLAQVTL